MFEIVNPHVVRERHEQRVRPERIQGVRRGARLIQLEIRRARRAGHQR
ncbi:MAG: hypothetical protein V9F82_10540 [Dermatophilaceae bacterium]